MSGTPRIKPSPIAEWSDEAKKALAPVIRKDGSTLNIFATFARNPNALRAFLGWGVYVLQHTDLDPREREILILRTGRNCKAPYEIAQHERIGRHLGMSEEELTALQAENAAYSWGEREQLLVAAADELARTHRLSDELWSALAAHYSETQMMDIVFVVAQYTQVSMALNAFGVTTQGEV